MLLELGLSLETLTGNNNLYKEILSLGSAYEVQEWFKELFICITNHVGSRKNAKNKGIADSVAAYVLENYSGDLSLVAIAEKAYLSVPYLSKIFKDETGKTIKQFISEVRIEKAKEYLKNPKYRISEVSQMVGYDRIHGFLRLFKEATGMTPGEYRATVVFGGTAAQTQE